MTNLLVTNYPKTNIAGAIFFKIAVIESCGTTSIRAGVESAPTGNVLTPFPDVAVHIVQSPIVR
jgi:hypothetical protein